MDNNGNELASKIRNWTIKHNVSRRALTKLFHILKPYHTNLPLDSRTLLMTCIRPIPSRKLDKRDFFISE